MSSLYQLYKHKDKNGTGTVVNKTYVPLSELYVEPGLNIREIDQDHVAEFRDAFIAGESVPPLDVQVTEKGVKVIDGHHRYYGAIEATKAVLTSSVLSAKTSSGTKLIVSPSWLPGTRASLSLLWNRAAAYQRLRNQGGSRTRSRRRLSVLCPTSTITCIC